MSKADGAQNSFNVTVDGVPQLLFTNLSIRTRSSHPLMRSAFTRSRNSIAQQRRLRWQIGGAGALLLLLGFVASHFIAARLSVPVEKLAVDSEENRAHWREAEAALASTQRGIRTISALFRRCLASIEESGHGSARGT